MDMTQQQITKIAREVGKFTVQMLKLNGIGTAEYDYLHVIRKNPGITQARIREILCLDKGAAARRTANLEFKGYLVRKPNPHDRRSQLIFATGKAETLKYSKAFVEALYYEWLSESLTEQDKTALVRLINDLYQKAKSEGKSGFVHLTERFAQQQQVAYEES
ncbi:MAG: helix-turn-helix domain-containing protein [Oscillospiraceae bacterium]